MVLLIYDNKIKMNALENFQVIDIRKSRVGLSFQIDLPKL